MPWLEARRCQVAWVRRGMRLEEWTRLTYVVVIRVDLCMAVVICDRIELHHLLLALQPVVVLKLSHFILNSNFKTN